MCLRESSVIVITTGNDSHNWQRRVNYEKENCFTVTYRRLLDEYGALLCIPVRKGQLCGFPGYGICSAPKQWDPAKGRGIQVISFNYVNKAGSTAKSVTLSAEQATDQSFSEDSTLVEYGERKLYYSTIQANSISWIDGDVYYMLMDINKAVTKDELTAMAKEIIDLDMTSAQ